VAAVVAEEGLNQLAESMCLGQEQRRANLLGVTSMKPGILTSAEKLNPTGKPER
jgi:hypothetical protein